MKSIILLLFFSINLLAAQDWITQCIELTINTKFNEAESLLTTRMEAGDSSLEINFYYASVLNSKMTHFENKADQKEFYKALNRVIEKGQRFLENEKIDSKAKAQMLFYIGSAFGYLGFYQGQIGEWFSAVKNGSKAHKFLLQAVEMDSTVWDAYLGLGTFKYWLSTKVHWIPFIPDEREEGIALINKTIEHHTNSRFMAMHQLVYILLDFEDYDQAEKISKELITHYPESQFMYWAYAHVFMKKKDFPKAISAYKKLLRLINMDINANPNHRITCLARLGDMYARAGDCIKANEAKLKIEQDDFFTMHATDDEVIELLLRISENCGL